MFATFIWKQPGYSFGMCRDVAELRCILTIVFLIFVGTTSTDMDREICSICQDEINFRCEAFDWTTLPCCEQLTHTACIATWRLVHIKPDEGEDNDEPPVNRHRCHICRQYLPPAWVLERVRMTIRLCVDYEARAEAAGLGKVVNELPSRQYRMFVKEARPQHYSIEEYMCQVEKELLSYRRKAEIADIRLFGYETYLELQEDARRRLGGDLQGPMFPNTRSRRNINREDVRINFPGMLEKLEETAAPANPVATEESHPQLSPVPSTSTNHREDLHPASPVPSTSTYGLHDDDTLPDLAVTTNAPDDETSNNAGEARRMERRTSVRRQRSTQPRTSVRRQRSSQPSRQATLRTRRHNPLTEIHHALKRLLEKYDRIARTQLIREQRHLARDIESLRRQGIAARRSDSIIELVKRKNDAMREHNEAGGDLLSRYSRLSERTVWAMAMLLDSNRTLQDMQEQHERSLAERKETLEAMKAEYEDLTGKKILEEE